MTEDLKNKLRPNTDDNVMLILKAVQDLTFRVGMSEQKFEDFAEKLDRRLNDTDSILQNVVADIAHLQEGQRRLEEGQRRLEEWQGRLEEGQGRLEEGQMSLRSDLTALRHHVDQQFRTLSGTVEGRYREHDKRITRLEANANPPNTQT
jgi:DNA repair exonuclease SbcCD ATPase subunit